MALSPDHPHLARRIACPDAVVRDGELRRSTEEAVGQLFAARRPTRIRRHELPRLHALNFVLEGVLDGGVNRSLNLDAHGKSLAFLLLGMSVRIPSPSTPLPEALDPPPWRTTP